MGSPGDIFCLLRTRPPDAGPAGRTRRGLEELAPNPGLKQLTRMQGVGKLV
jgi:hypothetical protein